MLRFRRSISSEYPPTLRDFLRRGLAFEARIQDRHCDRVRLKRHVHQVGIVRVFCEAFDHQLDVVTTDHAVRVRRALAVTYARRIRRNAIRSRVDTSYAITEIPVPFHDLAHGLIREGHEERPRSFTHIRREPRGRHAIRHHIVKRLNRRDWRAEAAELELNRIRARRIEVIN